jgi:hypothetical protein
MTRPGRLLTTFMDVSRKRGSASGAEHAKLRDLLNFTARHAVKFISPQSVKLDKSKPMLLSDLRPPYPVTALEGEMFGIEGAAGLIIARDTGEHVELNFICRMHEGARALAPELHEWLFTAVTCRIQYSDASFHEPWQLELKDFSRRHPWTEPRDTKSYAPFLNLYGGVCQILANHDVETTDVLADAKEARSRRIRDKAPLFTYKTLTIGAPKTRPAGKGGGTHASPRAHLRRGFYRTSKTGVRHWVQATVVKGDTPGFVYKDYQIEQRKEKTND